MAQQLSFDLPAKPALGREDFFVAPSNALAVAMIESTLNWPMAKLVLSGPAGSGKTHLAHVWARETRASILSATELAETDPEPLSHCPVAVEDIPAIAENMSAQIALFHLHNMLVANGQPLLMTGQPAPSQWALSLPDLQSRVEGAAHVALDAPDDTLLAVVMAKLFSDRQITPRPDVIPYLVSHMDRSFQAAADMVERMDRVSLAESRTLSRALAARLLKSASQHVEDAAPLQD
jgi:chromosomal replication initiation ATPase DnaA